MSELKPCPMTRLETAKKCFLDTVKLISPNTPEYRMVFTIPLKFYLGKLPQEAAKEICFLRWKRDQGQKMDEQTLNEVFSAMDDCDKYRSLISEDRRGI